LVLSEFLAELRSHGLTTTEMQLRWAHKSGKLARPRLDAAHRFDFSATDVERAVEFFKSKARGAEVAHAQ
jgi:hypothetical protein